MSIIYGERIRLRATEREDVWVGIGARIQHQEKSDWVELRNFTLRAAH